MTDFPWKKLDFIENSPENEQVYLVCGRIPRFFWVKAFYIYGYTRPYSPGSPAVVDPTLVDIHPTNFLPYWKEGWYELTDDDTSASPLPYTPSFYAEVDLPIALLS